MLVSNGMRVTEILKTIFLRFSVELRNPDLKIDKVARFETGRCLETGIFVVRLGRSSET